MIDDIIVRLIDMPYSIKGYTMPSPDGAYNVYINSRYSFESRQNTLEHELRHIRCNDFLGIKSVHEIERHGL